MFYFKRQPLIKDKDGNYIKKEDGTYERGKEQVSQVQGALRPIQLWEYVVPGECIPETLAMLNQHKYAELRPAMKTPAWLVRKMYGARPVNEFRLPEHQDKERWQITQKFVPSDAVATYLLGVKTDVKQDFIFHLPSGAKEGWYQEGL